MQSKIMQIFKMSFKIYNVVKCVIPISFLILVLLSSSISCEEEPSHAIELTTIDFNSEIGSINYFVMFHAPW